jgi:hypothetical protein
VNNPRRKDKDGSLSLRFWQANGREALRYQDVNGRS